MPNKALKGIAKKTGTSIKTTKRAEDKAKKEYPAGTPDRWKKVMGTTKKIQENREKSNKHKK